MRTIGWSGLNALFMSVTRTACVRLRAFLLVRPGDTGSFLFAINHTAGPLDAHASGTDLLTGTVHTGVVTVPAGGVVVIDETR